MSYRRGACPALSAPMPTGDGLLVRLATAGASLTPAQLLALCAAAERHGNGLVEITARGNFQIRGLSAESATALARDIDAVDLGLRDGVPVETNPLAALDPTEIANAAPLAAALREAIDATDLASRLAPKVSVVVDGGGVIDMSALTADLRLTAVRKDASAGWLVSTGGDGTTATSLAIADDDAAAQAAALAILEAVAAHGRNARARDLEPTEIKALVSPFNMWQSHPPPPPTEPVLGPASGRTRVAVQLGEPRVSPVLRTPRFAGEDPRSRTAATPDLPPFTGEGDHAKRGEGGVIALTDDRIALPVALPFGSMQAGELAAFIEETQAHAGEFRLAPGRCLIPICASEQAASAVLNAARAAGLIVDAADPRARIFACPGSAGCASGHIAAREIAAAVAHDLADIAPEFELHISGCPKGCAHPARASLTLVGTEAGPSLIENGTTRESGMPFGNQDVAARLASAMRSHANSHSQPQNRHKPRPIHALAGE